MRRLTDTDGLSDVQRDILRTVRDFVHAEVLPVAAELDRTDAYPDKIVDRDAPMLLIGEGTSEVQKMIIGQRIVSSY
jgi:alkylation response protein AidB-like acyl-CoA dehydrogenase